MQLETKREANLHAEIRDCKGANRNPAKVFKKLSCKVRRQHGEQLIAQEV